MRSLNDQLGMDTGRIRERPRKHARAQSECGENTGRHNTHRPRRTGADVAVVLIVHVHVSVARLIGRLAAGDIAGSTVSHASICEHVSLIAVGIASELAQVRKRIHCEEAFNQADFSSADRGETNIPARPLRLSIEKHTRCVQ